MFESYGRTSVDPNSIDRSSMVNLNAQIPLAVKDIG
jgi:hypothetical protein